MLFGRPLGSLRSAAAVSDAGQTDSDSDTGGERSTPDRSLPSSLARDSDSEHSADSNRSPRARRRDSDDSQARRRDSDDSQARRRHSSDDSQARRRDSSGDSQRTPRAPSRASRQSLESTSSAYSYVPRRLRRLPLYTDSEDDYLSAGEAGRPAAASSDDGGSEVASLVAWSDAEDSDDAWIDGNGGYYGGYGRCFVCGFRGHWAPGCPFR